ncbi:hypothetical protein TNCV_330961 [Trichonephila clavipes]|nr:hypothetical protein TNCV_330961 [Trichonephila clavipes]
MGLGRQVDEIPTTKNTLIRALTEEWDKLPQQLLDNVVQRGATADQLLHRSVNSQVANVASKNDANLALSLTFHYVFIESPL